MDLMGRDSILQLRDMLQAAQPQDDSSDEEPTSSHPMAKMGPADVGPKKKAEKAPPTTAPKPATKDIWEEEEVTTGAEYEDVLDPRPQPEYDVVFKQAVTSEDIFLQMGNKNLSSASCEDMVVKIKLPGHKSSEVELDVTDKFLDCRTPKFKLGLHLPHPVDSKNGRAQWVQDQEMLVVTLRMVRDLDFVNF
ncbi:dynein axonemal assembly factor 6-like [Branchiostoma floridae x Branchiostoma belcheri]